MRIMTVRQPWALHIIQSGKDVENRSRNIAGDYRGPVAIHAALKMDDDAMYRLPMRAPNGIPRSFWTGVIIGVADLVDVHFAGPDYESIGAGVYQWTERVCCGEWAQRDSYHLKLANPRMLAAPMPYRGALGLRALPADAIAQIEGIGFRALPEPVFPESVDSGSSE